MKLDASALGAVERRVAVDVRKLSGLVGAGQVVETSDGRRFRVASKIASSGGVSFCLTNPVESFHVTANQLADMDPLPGGLVRLAHFLRRWAFNKDFDEYVKTAIRAHGLPVDEAMNWSKWLEDFGQRYLGNHAEGEVDEALHEFIIDLIYQKDILAKYNPKKVKSERGRGRGPGGMVTAYLTRMFTTYRSMALRSLNQQQTTMPGKKNPKTTLRENLGVPMIQPYRDTGEEVNILDTLERAHQPEDTAFEAESWEDVSSFRASYGEWLEDHLDSDMTRDILKLLDIIIKAEIQAGDDISEMADQKNKWMGATGKSLASYQVYATKLSETLHKFVGEYPELAETSLIARLIGGIKAKKPTTKSRVEGLKSSPRVGSLSLVAVAPSEIAQIPGDTGRLPHDNTGGTSNAVIILDNKPPEPPRTVAPEIPVVQHGL